MILVLKKGRFGNQIFQYMALRNLYPNNNIFFFGYDDISNNLIGLEGCFIRMPTLRGIITPGRLNRIINLLLNLRLIGRIYESYQGDVYQTSKKRGVLFFVYVSQYNFFQNNKFFRTFNSAPLLKSDVRSIAKKWLYCFTKSHPNYKRVFIHVRRGDYLLWPNRENPAVLDLNWYTTAMERFRLDYGSILFIVITDDVDYCAKAFSGFDDVVLSKKSFEVDFAIMSYCKGGILSASSFSWWGAFYSKIFNQDNLLYIAPRYWIGHRSKKWYPEGIQTDWLTYQ